MAPKYKLTYFTLKGLAEPIRFILSYMDADFEDNRIEFSDWPALKDSAPFGKLPYIEFDGKVLSQSVVISRYLGKKAGIAGDNEWEDAKIDMAVDTLRDLVQDVISWHREENPAAKAKKDEVLKNETIPFYLEKIDNLIKENGGYIANNKLSWGDMHIVSVVDYLKEGLKFDLSKYENLSNLYEKILNLSSIKKWVEKRPMDKLMK